MNIKLLCVVLLLAVCIQACDDNQKAKNYNNRTLVDDQGLDFIKSGHEAGLTEMKAASVAQTISKNPQVLSFAKMMIDDHAQIGTELAKLAKNRMVDLDNTLSEDHQKAIDTLSKLNGNEFDKKYMDMMVKGHTKVVTLFEANTSNKTGYVQEFAKKYLPNIQHHLDTAKAIRASLK